MKIIITTPITRSLRSKVHRALKQRRVDRIEESTGRLRGNIIEVVPGLDAEEGEEVRAAERLARRVWEAVGKTFGYRVERG